MTLGISFLRRSLKMEEILKVESLDRLLRDKKKHTVGDALDVLPFLTKRTKAIKDHFHGVMGEYIRRICEVKIRNQKERDIGESHDSENELVHNIIKQVNFDDENSKYDLERFLSNHLFTNEIEIKPIHPYLFNYVSIPEKNSNEFIKYAKFLRDVFAEDNKTLKVIFEQKEHHDILTELILSNIDSLKSTKSEKQQYQSLLPSISALYEEDLLYLSRHQDYFLQMFGRLTHFYMMTYACQLLMKLEMFDKADYSKATPLYYALDWESVSKRRKPASDLEGFKFIKEKANHFFVHIHTLSHLSYNNLNTQLDHGKNPIMNYCELYQKAKEANVEHILLTDLNKWIDNYRDWQEIKDTNKATNISEAFGMMFNCLKQGTNKTVCEKFGKNIEDLASGEFIKFRGSLGHVLNMNHEMLLLLTAVSVKDERIPLNQLFDEFARRGVMFDRYSKKEIIVLFDSLNILDKKSDSGDAQYVKPIL